MADYGARETDLGAAFGQLESSGGSDAAGSARNDGNLAGKSEGGRGSGRSHIEACFFVGI